MHSSMSVTGVPGVGMEDGWRGGHGGKQMIEVSWLILEVFSSLNDLLPAPLGPGEERF